MELQGELDEILAYQYEAQHFGFHPRKFLDSVYNILFENLISSLNQLKQYMIQEFGTVMPPHAIQTQIDTILQELVKHCDKCIDKLETYLKSAVFSIPNHVTLPEDEIHLKSPCVKDEEEKLDREIEELKRKIIEERAKKFIFKQKITEQKEVKQRLLYLQNEIVNLLNFASQKGVYVESIEAFFKNITQLSDLNIWQQVADFSKKI